MIRSHLPEVVQEGGPGAPELKADLDYAVLAAATEGYSGSDLRLVCKEVRLRFAHHARPKSSTAL